MKRNKNKISGNFIRLAFFNKTDRIKYAGSPWDLFNLVKSCGLISNDNGTVCDWSFDGSVFVEFEAKQNETPESFAEKMFLLARALVCQLEDNDDPYVQTVSVRVSIGNQRSDALFVADAKTGVDFLPAK